jgi:hypothetical protein
LPFKNNQMHKDTQHMQHSRGTDAASHQRKEEEDRFITWRADPEDIQAMTSRDARDKAMREFWALYITNIRARGAPAFTRQARA